MANRFLSLPIEIRNRVYDELLQSRSTPTISHQNTYEVAPAILQTCRQIYREAYPIFQANHFICVSYSGPADCAFRCGFVRARVVPLSSMMMTRVAVAQLDVKITRPELEASDVTHLLAVMTLEAFAIYFHHLHSRQLRWIPDVLIERPTTFANGEHGRLRIHIKVAFPTPAAHLPNETRDGYHSRLDKEEELVLAILYRSCYIETEIVKRPQSLLGSRSLVRCKSRDSSATLNEWMSQNLSVSLARKRQIDSHYLVVTETIPALLYYIMSEYRTLCLDLQYFVECCELVHDDESAEVLGTYRDSVMTLLFSSFYCYTYTCSRHEMAVIEYWPFQRPCDADVCTCHALVHTDAHIDDERPSPDLSIQLEMWSSMRHLAALTHYLYGADQNSPTAKETLATLQNIGATGLRNVHIQFDQQILRNIIDEQDHSRHASSFSVFALPRRILGESGQVLSC